MKKKISVCIPCYNEEENIMNIYERITDVLSKMKQYDYEIIFADNCSSDSSQDILRELTGRDSKVKAIFNNRNFGADRSAENACFAATGDCIISIACDLQDPPEMISAFIEEWEKGNKIIWGQKIASKENSIKYFCRSLYYKIIRKFSEVSQYEHVTGFGLMDKQIVDVIKTIYEPNMSMRNLIPDLGFPVKLIPYIQEKRKAGKSSYNLWRYFDFSVSSLVQVSTVPLRLMTIMGIVSAVLSFLFGVIYLVYKLIYWDVFSVGIAPIVIAVFFLGSVQLLCMGMIGEYIGVILRKVTKRPIVTEKERLNFDKD